MSSSADKRSPIQADAEVCRLFKQALQQNQEPEIESFVSGKSAEASANLFRRLLQIELEMQKAEGAAEESVAATYVSRFPEHKSVIHDVFEETFSNNRKGSTVDFGDGDHAQHSDITDDGDATLAASAEPAQDHDMPKTVIGDYEVIDEIGRGGMGVVFKALQRALKRTVALKVIRAGYQAEGDEIKRFKTEAESVARLDHPGIVTIYEVGDDLGQHFFSMEFVAGQSLSGRIQTGPLGFREAAKISAQISEAVAYAHGRGVVHRDLKPANVLLDPDGQPKVTDFGLAKRLDDDSELTATGQILGTPSYMPPEQAKGDLANVGPLSDVYSIGALLYACLTGAPPFRSATGFETIRQVIEGDLVSPRRLNSQIPLDLETICLKCLEREPSRRYQSADEVAAELRRYLNGEPIHARRVSPIIHAWRWCRRYPAVASLGGAVLASLLLGIGVSSYFALLASARADSLEKSIQGEKAATAAAQEQGKIAIGTLETVVFQVDQELAELPGSTGVRKRILETVLGNLEKVTIENNSQVDLTAGIVHFQFAQMLEHINDENGQPSAEAAIQQYQSSLKRLEGIVEATPDDHYARSMLALAQGNYGSHLHDVGRSAEAEELITKALENIRMAHAQNPDETRYQAGLALALHWMGEIRFWQGNIAASKKLFTEAVAVTKSLREAQPDNKEVAALYSTSLAGLADAMHEQGNLAEAEKLFEETLKNDRFITSQNEFDIHGLIEMSITLERLAMVRLDRNDPEGARKAYEQSIEVCRQAIALEPNNFNAQMGLAYELDAVSKDIFLPAREFSKARVALEEAIAIRQQVADVNPGDGVNQQALNQSKQLLKRVQRASSAPAQ